MVGIETRDEKVVRGSPIYEQWLSECENDFNDESDDSLGEQDRYGELCDDPGVGEITDFGL